MSQAIRNKTHLSDQVAVRLSADLPEALEEAASTERRSPSALIRIFVEDALKARATIEAHVGRMSTPLLPSLACPSRWDLAIQRMVAGTTVTTPQLGDVHNNPPGLLKVTETDENGSSN